MLESLSPRATILASSDADESLSMASCLRRCQLASSLSPFRRTSLSASTMEAILSPNSRRRSSTVTSVSSTVSCSMAADRSSWSGVMVATMEVASRRWTMYGKPFPLRSVPECAFTAKLMARSRRNVSIGPFAIIYWFMKGKLEACSMSMSAIAWLDLDLPLRMSNRYFIPARPPPLFRMYAMHRF